ITFGRSARHELCDSQSVLAASSLRADGSGSETAFLPNQPDKKFGWQLAGLRRRFNQEADRLLGLSACVVIVCSRDTNRRFGGVLRRQVRHPRQKDEKEGHKTQDQALTRRSLRQPLRLPTRSPYRRAALASISAAATPDFSIGSTIWKIDPPSMRDHAFSWP